MNDPTAVVLAVGLGWLAVRLIWSKKKPGPIHIFGWIVPAPKKRKRKKR